MGISFEQLGNVAKTKNIAEIERREGLTGITHPWL